MQYSVRTQYSWGGLVLGNAWKHRFMSIWAQLQCVCVCVYCTLACHYQFHWAQMKFVSCLQTRFFVVSSSSFHFPFISSWFYFSNFTSTPFPFFSPLPLPFSFCPAALFSFNSLSVWSALFVFPVCVLHSTVSNHGGVSCVELSVIASCLFRCLCVCL